MEISEEMWAGVLGRIELLERRTNSLEAVAFKQGTMAQAVRKVIESLKGPFTANQVQALIVEQHPDLLPARDYYQVANYCWRLAKHGDLLVRHQGTGPHPTIYERIQAGPIAPHKGGQQRGRHHQGQSGIRNIIRSAIDDLPEQWTSKDLAAWMQRRKLPELPKHTFKETLYQMRLSKELTLIQRRRKGGPKLNLYMRGERTILPSGDLLDEAEATYRDFRKTLQTPKAEPESDCVTAETSLQEMEKNWAKYRAKCAAQA